MSVEVKQLTKRFNGQAAVLDVSFMAKENQIVGFLGPNGAGKSTTMKIITCFLPPTSGTVLVNDMDVTTNPGQIKKITGYLPENNPLYLEMYVHEYLRFIGKLNGIDGSRLKLRVGEMIDLCRLEREQNKVIGSLSKGYRQRVGLAQTLIHDPKVLILDEPTTGLDPNQITEVRNLIKEISKEKTVILSTHIMQEVQAICDKVVIINEGQIVADGRLDEIQNNKSDQQRIKLRFSSPVPLEEFEAIQEIEKVVLDEEHGMYIVMSKTGRDARPAINRLVSQKEIDLLEMAILEESLEDVFRQLTKKLN